MPRYDARFAPPAPVAAINLRSIDRRKRVSNVAMFIDSGADVTFLPASAVNQLGLPNQGDREVTAFDGSESVAEGHLRCGIAGLGLLFDRGDVSHAHGECAAQNVLGRGRMGEQHG